MITLNLNDENLSDIKYKISQYPDGQQDVQITNFKEGDIDDDVMIISRFRSFKNLELIICATKALKRLYVEKISLYIPYLLGARSDRQFKQGGTSYLVDVIAPIINAQKYYCVISIDVHSNVALACINNLKIFSNFEFVKSSVENILKTTKNNNIEDIVFLAPDAGASHKIYASLDEAGINNPIVLICSKERDNNGKLSRTVVPLYNKNYEGKTFVIIDDICDGGRTFNEIAKSINNEGYENNDKFLIVSHGIFSAGFEELSKHFKNIYCTNSYSDIGDLTSKYGKLIPTYVKQENILNL